MYAKTKGELLHVQNSSYAGALVEGGTPAKAIPDVLDAVMAIIRPVVECVQWTGLGCAGARIRWQ